MEVNKRQFSWVHAENILGGFFLLLLAFFPILDKIVQLFNKSGILGIIDINKYLLLWVAFISGMIASREQSHLSLASDWSRLGKSFKGITHGVTAALGCGFSLAFSLAALSFSLLAFDKINKFFFIPLTVVVSIMAVGFLFIAIRFITKEKEPIRKGIIIPVSIILGIYLSLPTISNIVYYLFPEFPPFLQNLSIFYYTSLRFVKWPLLALLLGSGVFGTPIFILLGGLAYLFFSGSWGALEAIPNEAFNLLSDHAIPAIPLFTLTGFILSESKAGERLVKVFRVLLGWLPGGLVIMAVFVCAFFTTFTGASGVTILALGGMLAYILTSNSEYSDRYTRGLLTSSGSIGLLFPPSLPIIMYGVVAQINIKHLFLGGLIPGSVLVLALSATGIFVAIRKKRASGASAFSESIKSLMNINLKDVFSAFLESIGELLLPVIIIILFFTGITNDLVVLASLSVVYVVILEVFIKRDLKIRDLYKVLNKCLPIIGGVLIIIAMAKGLSNYIVDAEIPMLLTDFFNNYVHSKVVFLILLNIVLLITGCLMDIYSAILVVAPLIIPLGLLYGVHPVQLGIIFLANLELGYLTPPVGLNLFLSSYTFDTPLTKIYKSVWPFFLILLAMILLITFVPWLSLAFVPG